MLHQTINVFSTIIWLYKQSVRFQMKNNYFINCRVLFVRALMHLNKKNTKLINKGSSPTT